ncbi:MAG: T9SS type A sorting domain-containing protein [Chitinophagaceae bacterium]|nr:T9SS type A sorting domain-containing protein [Chitinophagaceae bacterium]
MDGKGIPIAGITTDYDLQSRDAVAPDMGADEFTSTAGNTLYNSVGTTVTDIRTITATETYRASNCERFNVLQPNGASPVSGSVTARVYKYATVQTYNAEPYVQRVIDITPATNAATATGRVTLYYTQLEFDDYNTASGAWPDLPTGAGDATGIANLRITKYGGTPNVTPSLPNQYSGGANEYINPADVDIVWNATDNRWEITLDITGFSGFYIHTNPNFALPIVVNYLQGTKQGGSHNLNWKVTCASSSSATMVLERSADNRNFAAINTVTADALRCAQPFNYVDASPLAGVNYYRLRITDANGKVTYSNTIALVNKLSGVEIVGIAPNPVTSAGAATLNVASAQQGTLKIVVTDLAGRQLITQTEKIIAGSNQIPMNFAKLSGGSYQVTAITEDGKATSVRFIKQ